MALNGNQREWRGSFVESIVLIKTEGAWRIALGHTSSLPKPKDWRSTDFGGREHGSKARVNPTFLPMRPQSNKLRML